MHELAVFKRQQLGKRSEQLNTEQMSLLDEAIDMGLAATEAELEQLQPDTPEQRSRQQRARRAPLPAHLPRWSSQDFVETPIQCSFVAASHSDFKRSIWNQASPG